MVEKTCELCGGKEHDYRCPITQEFMGRDGWKHYRDGQKYAKIIDSLSYLDILLLKPKNGLVGERSCFSLGFEIERKRSA